MTPPELLQIVSPDGAICQGVIVVADAPCDDVALIVPAMGVPARFYAPFAASLQACGVASLTMELRGTGTSSVRASRSVDFGYDAIVRHDLPAAVAAARQHFGSSRVHAIGHSLGGQMASLVLAREPALLASLCLVASGSVDYRGFAGWQAYSVLVRSQLARLLALTLGYYPGHRVGFGNLQPRQLMIDWSDQIRTGRYAPAGPPFDYEAALGQAQAAVLAISLVGDTLSTAQSCDLLCAKLSAARIDRHHLNLPMPEVRNGSDVHFRWVRNAQPIARQIATWIRALRGQ